MKTILFIFCLLFISSRVFFAQDTFSIVAVDSVTGEVGSAGASCVDLFQFGLPSDHFLGKLFPGIGAINTQAYYVPTNQNNATNRMDLGDSPSEIIDWLINNDVSGQPEIRQYGIAALMNSSPQTAAHTGSATDDYKNHITGSNYSIQGNILLGQKVLDSMEVRFLNEEGDLACKLMAALQGANMIGADTRCASNGTSSLFAFVKVAQPTDVFGIPSFVVSVKTSNNDGIEPIDSLQTKFNLLKGCGETSIHENTPFDQRFTVSPNPAWDYILIESKSENPEASSFVLYKLNGELLREDCFTSAAKVKVTDLDAGVHIIKIKSNDVVYTKRIIKQ